MKEKTQLILDDDQIKTERKNNLMNIENTIKNHNKGKYDLITSNIDLTTDEKFWIIDSGAKFNISSDTGINFYHEMLSMLKGIILNHPLNGDFKLKFKLNYQVLVNFYLGKDSLINFRNKDLKNDVALKTNVWHDMEFTRKDGVVSIIADGNLIRTVPSDETLFVIRVYNDNREVNIKEFHAKLGSIDTDETTPENRELLEARIAYLENLIKHPDDEVPELKKELEQYKIITDRVLDSYNFLFNTIFMDYELKPKKTLHNLQTLITELLEFVSNVCKKHDLTYWLDYGNLLGAVRHDGFIPWDDDADLGMLRKDFIKFKEIFEKEVMEHNLGEYIKIVRHQRDIEGHNVDAFYAIRFYYTMKTFKHKRIVSNVDIFPYDFIKDYNETGFQRRFRAARKNFYQNNINNMDKDEIYKQYFEELNLSLDEADHFMPGVEAIVRFELETEKVFPLEEMEFCGKKFSCPKDLDYYLTKAYGDYMSIPKRLHRHNRMALFRNYDESDKLFEECISILREANKNF